MDRRTIIKVIICVLLIALVVLFGIGFIKNAGDELSVMTPGFKNLSQVIIHADGKVGRGVIFDIGEDYIDILTAKHVVSETSTPEIELGDETRLEAKVQYYFADHDAAIIRISSDTAGDYMNRLKAVKVMNKNEYKEINKDYKVYYAQSLKDKELDVIEGKWLESDVFLEVEQEKVGIFEGSVVPGMSGGGLFDENDKLIGIIVASNEQTGAILPAYDLINLYGGYNE